MMKERITHTTIVTTRAGYAGVGYSDGNKIARFWLPVKNKDHSIKELSAWCKSLPTEDESSDLAIRVIAYYEGEKIRFNDRVDLSSHTDFAQNVYKELRKVKWGSTLSYQQLAEKCGAPKAARAIGGIMGANKIPLIIPCHRVVRTDGNLGGFSALGGVDTKRMMLIMESR